MKRKHHRYDEVYEDNFQIYGDDYVDNYDDEEIDSDYMELLFGIEELIDRFKRLLEISNNKRHNEQHILE